MELEQCFDGYGETAVWTAAHDYEKRIDILSGFAQHQWQVLPSLTLTAGMRYETVDIRVGNYSTSSGAIFITDQPLWIDRSFDGWVPKSWINYELDKWAPWFRDTSLSLGLSRIWRAPDYHGDYNPQGKPAGAWLDPEHGMGCDEDTSVIVDYEFQDKQVIEQAEEVAPDEWTFESVPINAYHRVDLAVSHVLFQQWGTLSDGTLKVYAGNVFNETYEDADGYPATDRTFGIGFSVSM